MNADDSLELFTVFTQSRSDANMHYIAIGQRLNDISSKVVERLRPFIGLTLGENSLRKLKAMIPDNETKKRIQQLPKRHWIYLDGKTNPEIEIPTYKKEGNATYLKPTIPEQPQTQPFIDPWKQPKIKLGLLQRFTKWLFATNSQPQQYTTSNNIKDDNSEYDGVMTLDDDEALFPAES